MYQGAYAGHWKEAEEGSGPAERASRSGGVLDLSGREFLLNHTSQHVGLNAATLLTDEKIPPADLVRRNGVAVEAALASSQNRRARRRSSASPLFVDTTA